MTEGMTAVVVGVKWMQLEGRVFELSFWMKNCRISELVHKHDGLDPEFGSMKHLSKNHSTSSSQSSIRLFR